MGTDLPPEGCPSQVRSQLRPLRGGATPQLCWGGGLGIQADAGRPPGWCTVKRPVRRVLRGAQGGPSGSTPSPECEDCVVREGVRRGWAGAVVLPPSGEELWAQGRGKGLSRGQPVDGPGAQGEGLPGSMQRRQEGRGLGVRGDRREPRAQSRGRVGQRDPPLQAPPNPGRVGPTIRRSDAESCSTQPGREEDRAGAALTVRPQAWPGTGGQFRVLTLALIWSRCRRTGGRFHGTMALLCRRQLAPRGDSWLL